MTIAGKLVTIKCYDVQIVGLSLPLDKLLIRSVKQGIKGVHVEEGVEGR